MSDIKRHTADRDWWRGAVIYQIYPRSFQDSNGDGIGDLAGITARLPYLAALGVDAIWISPFMRSPMADLGYDISDYRDVDPQFGNLADLDSLVAHAHGLGLKVMMDLVLSHTSDQHPWFAESRRDLSNPRADWYVWADARADGSPPNNWLSNFGGSAWEWDAGRRQYYLHNFLIQQPDLNFHNEEVVEALLDVVRYWLDRGIDGFRLDTVNFYFHDADLRDNPPLEPAQWNERLAPRDQPYHWQEHRYDKNRPDNLGFLRRLRALLDRYPAVTAVGEVGELIHGTELMAEYTEGGDKLHMCYAFDLLKTPLPQVADIRPVIEQFTRAAPDGWACWAFSNHDVCRHATRWANARDDAARILRLAPALLLTLRGSVCLYQGEELGQTEADVAFDAIVDPWGKRFWPTIKGRDGCRTPMLWSAEAAHAGFTPDGVRPWLPIPAEHLQLAVDRQDDQADSLLAFYRRLLAWRRRHPALIKGDIRFVDLHPQVLAYQRVGSGERLLVAFHLGDGPALDLAIPLPLAELQWVDETPAGLGGAVQGQRLRLPAYSGLIARLADAASRTDSTRG